MKLLCPTRLNAKVSQRIEDLGCARRCDHSIDACRASSCKKNCIRSPASFLKALLGKPSAVCVTCCVGPVIHQERLDSGKPQA